MNEMCWSTAAVSPSDRRDFWRAAVGRAINDVDIRIEDSVAFAASLRQRQLGPLALSHIDVHGTQIVRRTRSIIERCDTALLSLIHFVSGQGWLRQRGREMPLREGECVILDNREAYEIAIMGRGESVSVHMPAEWVTRHVPDARGAVATSLPRNHPWVGRLVELMKGVQGAGSASFSADLFTRHFRTTLALALGPGALADDPLSPRSFDALQLTLSEMALVPNVRVEEVAAVHRMSVRQVHHVYAIHGTTIRSELMRLRLTRAREMLGCDRFDSLPVDEIARRCGFSDARHFRRRFSQQFGRSPAAHRS